MQHINDDMDELFRRAAQDYPLKTDSTDWNAVEKKIADDKAAEEKAITKKNNYKHLLWLLLLLPLGWMYKNYFSNNNGNGSPAISKNNGDKNLPHYSLSKSTAPQSNTVKSFTSLPQKTLAVVNSVAVINSESITRKTKGKLHSNFSKNNGSTFMQDKITESVINPVSETSGKLESTLVTGVKDKNDIKEDGNKTTEIKLDPANYRDKKVVEMSNNKETEIKKQKRSPEKKPGVKQEHGVYIGIVIGPDVSTVKFQSIKSIGINMGVLVGYQVNKKISVESGVSWSIKNYYSDGHNFNTKNIPLAYNAKIINVDGVCNMIEVPVVIKYNLTTGKTHFSTSAGFSSYFMKKEKYDYAIDNNGQQYKHSSVYNNSSTNLLAVANLAFGYNTTLKKNISLRLEPYVKIPLKGIGIGSLPIMSAGLNIGVTKKISR